MSKPGPKLRYGDPMLRKSVSIPKSIWEKCEMVAAQKNLPVSAIIREAILEYLEAEKELDVG